MPDPSPFGKKTKVAFNPIPVEWMSFWLPPAIFPLLEAWF